MPKNMLFYEKIEKSPSAGSSASDYLTPADGPQTSTFQTFRALPKKIPRKNCPLPYIFSADALTIQVFGCAVKHVKERKQKNR